MYRGKVLAQVVESTWLCEKTRVCVLCVPIMCCCCFIINFNNIYEHGSGNV